MTIHISKIISLYKSFGIEFRISKSKSQRLQTTARQKVREEKGRVFNFEKNLAKTNF